MMIPDDDDHARVNLLPQSDARRPNPKYADVVEAMFLPQGNLLQGSSGFVEPCVNTCGDKTLFYSYETLIDIFQMFFKKTPYFLQKLAC